MSADILLARLDGVRKTGLGRWVACCPAHDDQRPSLSIREHEDGRVLVHDFAGCCVEDILSAAGLTFEALFPELPIADHVKRERRPFSALDVLECVAHEALIVAIAASAIRRGETLSDLDHERLLTAASRLRSAAEVAHGQ